MKKIIILLVCSFNIMVSMKSQDVSRKDLSTIMLGNQVVSKVEAKEVYMGAGQKAAYHLSLKMKEYSISIMLPKPNLLCLLLTTCWKLTNL